MKKLVLLSVFFMALTGCNKSTVKAPIAHPYKDKQKLTAAQMDTVCNEWLSSFESSVILMYFQANFTRSYEVTANGQKQLLYYTADYNSTANYEPNKHYDFAMVADSFDPTKSNFAQSEHPNLVLQNIAIGNGLRELRTVLDNKDLRKNSTFYQFTEGENNEFLACFYYTKDQALAFQVGKASIVTYRETYVKNENGVLRQVGEVNNLKRLLP